jgi:RNA polymerase sigma-70 factor (ECF subfamily)
VNSSSSDSELINSLRNGNISAGGVLYERYKRIVYYFVLKMLRDDQSAHDVVQQTFIVMIEKIGSLKQENTFRAWLFSIARNESLMLLRRKRMIPMDGLDDVDAPVFDSETPETVYARNETAGIVRDALDRLTPAYREIILLRMTGQLSYEEIAAVTGASVSAVKSKLFKARTQLAVQLTRYVNKEDKQ